MKKFLALIMAVLMLATMMVGCTENTAKTAKVVEVDLTQEFYAFGVDKAQPELLEKTNAFIKQIKEDGTLDAICNKYFGEGTPELVESAQYDEAKDQLVVATNAAFEPFEYMEGDKYLGIDMEIAKLLADYLGMELVINNMEFDAVCLSVGQHKCDIAMAGLTINETRKESVDFTESYYEASQRLIVKSDDTTFDGITSPDEIEAKLNSLGTDTKVGYQNGTTGQFYVQGDADWGFAGLSVTGVGYQNGSLAVQDMLNGNLDYVIIDKEPALFITESINALA
ncbi:MAG: transporter substrate-binding domain-containing protein [Ruminococcus sp.]|nr:transporter substrate-binding domain-containing protein [Ruminococcus sp.]